ncbi:unnamed protein product [Mesocestoides corti]|uniref:RING-type domain-containing protein n=1 Tax=Mesocestoides corti TaxID=53468 RepID=A0A0R3U2L1_MESCO|nr:unnamed protein product [Mesocestoides corti]
MARIRGASRSSRPQNTNTSGRRAQKRQRSEPEEVTESEDRAFIRPSAISPHLFCVICSEVFNRPYRAPCGHSFCHACICAWLKNGACCPIDRKRLTVSQLHHDFILENIIGDYVVACPWRSSGCSYVGPLCQLASHKKDCVMNPDHLPPALRNRERENIRLLQSSGSSTSSLPEILLPTPVTIELSPDNSVSSLSGSIEVEVEDDALLPPPPPSLLMRLYQKADSDSRNLLCSFLSDSSNGPTHAPRGKRSRRRL